MCSPIPVPGMDPTWGACTCRQYKIACIFSAAHRNIKLAVHEDQASSIQVAGLCTMHYVLCTMYYVLCTMPVLMVRFPGSADKMSGRPN